MPFGDTASNDLHACNLKTLEWRKIKCRGPHPIKSYGHVSNSVFETFVKGTFDLFYINVNDFETKITARYSRVLIVIKLGCKRDTVWIK